MLRENIWLVVGWLRRAVTQPFAELNRWQRAARFAYDLGRYGARQLKEDRAPQMAAALAFRTLFGLAPVLVVATILVKSFRGYEAISAQLRKMLEAAGLDKFSMPVSSAVGESSEAAVTLAEWLENLASQLVNTNLSAIGWVGGAVIIYAAIGLMVTIENSFNIVYRAPGGRAWTRRVPLYWFLLTISPVMIALATYVNDQFAGWIASVHAWQWLLETARAVWSFGLVWLFMFAVYRLVPHSSVRNRPAMAGSFVSAVLMVIGKHTLGAYLGGAFAINQLYGSLGLIPLFMFWVYLMWLGVLFGLQVSATLQMLHGRSLDEMEHPSARNGLVDPAAVLTVVEVVAEQFVAGGRPMTVLQVADATSISEPIIARIVERLVQQEWLLRIEGPDATLSLARPPEQMNAGELIELGYQLVDEGQGRVSALVSKLRDAQQDAAEGVTLATLMA